MLLTTRPGADDPGLELDRDADVSGTCAADGVLGTEVFGGVIVVLRVIDVEVWSVEAEDASDSRSAWVPLTGTWLTATGRDVEEGGGAGIDTGTWVLEVVMTVPSGVGGLAVSKLLSCVLLAANDSAGAPTDAA